MADVQATLGLRNTAVPLAPSIRKVGLGYLGLWSEQAIQVELNQVHASRGGDVEGLLTINYGAPSPFVAKFNAASLPTRNSFAKHLTRISKYDGWDTILDSFCRHVLRLQQAGEDFVRLVEPDAPLCGNHLLTPILPANVATIFYGASGSMKSTVAAACGVAVSSNTTMLDWVPEKQAPVLILDYEATSEDWGLNMGAVARGVGVPLPDVIYRRCFQPLADMGEAIAAQVSTEGIGLVILDSLNPALASDGGRGDPGAQIISLFNALRSIRATWLLIDHLPKQTLDEGREGPPIGSIQKINQARSAYQFTKARRAVDKSAAVVRMHHYNVNRGPEQDDRAVLITHHDDRRVITVSATDLPPDLAGPVGAIQQIRDVLLQRGRLSRGEIVTHTGLPQWTVYKTIKRYLYAEGERPKLLQDLGDGKIGVVQP